MDFNGLANLLKKQDSTKKEIQKAIKKIGKDVIQLHDDTGQTIVHVCATEGRTDILDFLCERFKVNLEQKDNHGWTPIICATLGAKLDTIDFLLKKGVDSSITTSDNATCLHYYAKIKPTNKDEYESLYKKITKQFNNVDGANKNGETPLHKAVREGNIDFLKLLLASKANVNALDSGGESPLHYAARIGLVEVVKILLENGADIKLRGTKEGTPLKVAQKNKQAKAYEVLEAHANKSGLKLQDLLEGGEGSKSPRPGTTGRVLTRGIIEGSASNEPFNMEGIQLIVSHHGNKRSTVRGEMLLEKEVDEHEKRSSLVQRHESGVERAERIRRDEQRRFHILKEIVESEKRYVNLIKFAVRGILDAISTGTQPIITQSEAKLIFSTLPDIFLYGTNSLEGLESRLKSWSTNQRVGDVIMSMSDVTVLKTYTTYMSNFDNAAREVKRLVKKNKTFAEWLSHYTSPVNDSKKKKEDSAKKNSESTNLLGLLITPLQRIPKLVMLIEDLVRYTPAEHADQEDLRIACTRFKRVSEHLEEMRSDAQNRARVMRIKNTVVGFPEADNDLNRKYLLDGPAQLLYKGKVTPQHLFLFNDLLVWAKPTKLNRAGKGYEGFSCTGFVPVADIEVVGDVQSDVGKYTFEVSSRSKSQIFLAEREEDKRAWVRAVSRAVAKCPQPAQLPLWSRVTSSGPRPTPRSNHTTIYTAKHIIVFGGQRHSTWFNDCYVCDAETMEWIKVPDSESVPTPRSEHAAVTMDDKIYIFGGFDGSHRLNDMYIFDVKTLRWSKVEPNNTSSPNLQHASSSAIPTSPSSLKENEKESKWPEARSGHRMVRFGKEIYLFGGVDNSGSYLNDLYCLDEKMTWRWVRAKGEVPEMRAFHSMDVIAGLIWVFGGCAFKKYFNDTKVLDPSTRIWASLPSLNGTEFEHPSPRYSHGTAVIDSNLLMLYGGCSGATIYHDVWVLDTDTKTWVSVPTPIQLERAHRHTMTVLPGETGREAFVLGGESGTGYIDEPTTLKNFDLVRERVERVRVEQGKAQRRKNTLAPLHPNHPALSDIGSPYNIQKKAHLDEDYQWGGVDPDRDFEIKRILGEGAFGVVYEATFVEWGLPVAAKVIKDFKSERVKKEIDNLRKLKKHPNIVQFYGTVEKDNSLWIMMECELGSLKKLMTDVNQPLNEPQISIVCRNVLMGLNFLHRNNIVHRDIKCANVLFNAEGEIKLADFGISQQLTEELPHLRGLAGTLAWMAPEVHSRSNYDSKADVWSLGMTILEMLEGNVPKFDQRTMRMVSTSEALSSSTVNAGSLSVNEYIERCSASKDLRDFVSLCLNTNPDLRPTSIMLLEHPFIQSHVTSHQSDVFKDLISNFLRKKKRETRETNFLLKFRTKNKSNDLNTSGNRDKKGSNNNTKSSSPGGSHNSDKSDFDSLRDELFAQISSTKNETKEEIQRQLQLSRQETEVIRNELKKMREDLSKQKSKVQEMESKYKRRMTREVEKFKTEIIDQIQSNINKYVDLLVKEQTGKGSKQSSSPRGNGSAANGNVAASDLILEISRLKAENNAVREQLKTRDEELHSLKSRLGLPVPKLTKSNNSMESESVSAREDASDSGRATPRSTPRSPRIDSQSGHESDRSIQSNSSAVSARENRRSLQVGSRSTSSKTVAPKISEKLQLFEKKNDSTAKLNSPSNVHSTAKK